MARTLTPKDGYALINEIVRQSTGQKTVAAIDASTFVSAGETLLATQRENVLNALTMVLGRTFAAVRPYKARLLSLNAINSGVYTSRFRKISYYTQDALPSGYFNTDAFTNFAAGYTAGDNGGSSTKSQYEQHPPMPLEMNFGGSTTWQDCYTYYENKLQTAFKSVDDFTRFVDGFITIHANLIEHQKEAWNRMTLLSAVAARNYLEANSITSGCVINLTTEFNTFFGTNYTSAQLRSTYLKEFLEFMTAKIKETSDRFTEDSTAYHDPLTKTVGGINYSILRHTPKDRQKLMLYGPLWRLAESIVMPEIFNDQYLKLDRQFEPVEFWQNNSSDVVRPTVSYNGAYYDSVSGEQKATGAQSIDYLVGVLFDEDAIMTDTVLETVMTSAPEARKGFRNTWATFAFNAISDQTENMTIFIMDDSGVTP